MDNTGRGHVRFPGVGRISIEEELRCDERFAHGIGEWQQIPAVTAREFAMVAVMNTLTNKHIGISASSTKTSLLDGVRRSLQRRPS